MVKSAIRAAVPQMQSVLVHVEPYDAAARAHHPEARRDGSRAPADPAATLT